MVGAAQADDPATDEASAADAASPKREGKRARSASPVASQADPNFENGAGAKKAKVDEDTFEEDDPVGPLDMDSPRRRRRRRRSYTSSYAEDEGEAEREAAALAEAATAAVADPEKKGTVSQSTFLNLYFNPACHEEDTEIYSSKLGQQNAIRVGPEYQADLGVLANDTEPSPLASKCCLLWQPPSVQQDLGQYIRDATRDDERFGIALEQALQHLHAHAHDVAKATKAPQLYKSLIVSRVLRDYRVHIRVGFCCTPSTSMLPQPLLS